MLFLPIFHQSYNPFAFVVKLVTQSRSLTVGKTLNQTSTESNCCSSSLSAANNTWCEWFDGISGSQNKLSLLFSLALLQHLERKWRTHKCPRRRREESERMRRNNKKCNNVSDVYEWSLSQCALTHINVSLLLSFLSPSPPASTYSPLMDGAQLLANTSRMWRIRETHL